MNRETLEKLLIKLQEAVNLAKLSADKNKRNSTFNAFYKELKKVIENFKNENFSDFTKLYNWFQSNSDSN